MLDNPRDIMTGRTLGPADAEPSIEAVERYHTGQLKPFISSQNSSAPAANAANAPSPSSSSSPSPSASGGAGGSATAAATGAAGMGGSQ